ncbi:MAG TPA: PLP-dependent aminotransferase family protein [Oscillospiraceae bacterium]|nr:PLP-dependent aminotransferase family protein [Oscillospiraceae bacterium]
MLTYDLNDSTKECLYEQLYSFIKLDILNGRLQTNEKLPSKRSLALHLKVSVITVENAYAQLIAEGYVYSIEKRGYFVAKVDTKPQKTAQFLQNINEPTKKKYFMDFQKNSVLPETFPFTVWAKTMREVIQDLDKDLLLPTENNGTFELRQAIAKYLYSFRGMAVNPRHIIIGAGTEYLYNFITQLLGRDKVYAVENPGHTKITKIYRLNKVVCEQINLDSSGLSVKHLDKTKANVVHISPAHHYPTGIVMPVGRRQSLLKWANRKDGRYILEDDYDSEFRFLGKPIPTLFSIDDHEKVIYINTFSKTIAPSIRISYMVLPSHLFEKYNKEMSFYSCTVSSFEQYTLARFISNGCFEKHINRTKKIYRQKRDTIIRAINESFFAKIVTINEKKAGLHFLLHLNTNIPETEIKRQAEAEGIRLVFLSDYLFTNDKKYENILVINYSGIDITQLDEVIARLYKIFRKDFSFD